MNRTLKALMIAAAVTGAAYATSSLAQTPAPAPAAPATPSIPAAPLAPAAPASNAKPSNKAAMTEAKGPWLGTQMWKQAVYTMDNETRIGEIDNLIINRSGQIEAVVVGVGGFLGLGEKNVAFKYADLMPMVRNGNIWYMVKMTKEQINSLPAFDAAKYKL